MIETIKEICKERGITMIPFRNLFTHSAFSGKSWNGLKEFAKESGGGFAYHLQAGEQVRRVIFYNEEAAPDRLLYILAHEMGHHILGHLSYRRSEFESEEAKNSGCMENEARIFSVMITAMSLYDEIKQRDCVEKS